MINLGDGEKVVAMSMLARNDEVDEESDDADILTEVGAEELDMTSDKGTDETATD